MISNLQEEWRTSEPVLRLAFVLVWIASAISVLFCLLDYPVIGHDAYVHLNWLDQFTRIYKEGICYPRWLPDSFGGFGSPTFYFYPPLPYWVAGVIHSECAVSASCLYNILSLVGSLGACGTAWLLLREYSAKKLVVLTGALAYGFLGYHLCDVFVRDALGEHWALMFLPIVFGGSGEATEPRLLRAGIIERIGLLSLAWGGLFLTNMPLAYLAFLSMLVWVVAQKAWRKLLPQAIGLIVGALTAAIYLIPAIILRSDIHQRHLWDLPMHTSLFGFALLDMLHGYFDWLRVLSVGTLICGIIVIVSQMRAGGTKRNGWFWIGVVAVLLQIPLLSPLWRILWGMPFVQFSWRWNGILLLVVAVSSVTSPRKIIPCVLIGLSIVTILGEIVLSRNLIWRPPLAITSYRTDAPEYVPKWASNDPSEVITTTQRRMSDPPATMLGLVMPGDTVREISHNPVLDTFEVNLQRPTQVRFHQFYWQLWYAVGIDSALQSALQPDANGLATLNLPAGHYRLVLRLTEGFMFFSHRGMSWFGLSIMVLFLSWGFANYLINVRRRAASM